MLFTPGQTLDNTLGSLYVGSLLAAVLYGITSIQTYSYFSWFYNRDSFVHRVAVGLLWSLDTIHFVLVVHGVYYYCVESFENPLKLLTLVWSMKLQIVINVIIILLVQGLYAYRVWLLGGYHNRILAYIVIFITAGGFAVGMALAHAVYTLTFVADHEKIGWAIISSLATATFVDFFIAGAMVYYLRRSRGLQQHVNSKISTLMQMSLTSGILTSACSTAALITYVALPKTLIFMGVESFLTKLYINSFLAMLNARERHHDLPPYQTDSHSHSSRNGVAVHIQTLSKPGIISTSGSKSDGSNPRTSLSLYKSSIAPVSTLASPLESQTGLNDLSDKDGGVGEDRRRDDGEKDEDKVYPW
ncbi:hypothetical protein PC9H_008290 [Pleurotus ostreatus]|uniref:DUF6534 domain-containing protein n=2 Tax=Pleurotus ostreatus TaxID=5322 RepID=A0A067NXA9_PLEO1|nr:uncharacterized protein PC9H_008290 [Pleurotus ostreatus]KAF7425928.1 hypothetical protein PC9H_008290 [Pleurotus ostreatus]KDQ31640.1 hypothetical protein PLEOSDRAFT_1100180 [Pleurotus ostreatus PC15]